MLGNGVLIDGLRWPTLPPDEFRAESATSAGFKGPFVPSDGTAQVTFNAGLWNRFFGAVASAAAR